MFSSRLHRPLFGCRDRRRWATLLCLLVTACSAQPPSGFKPSYPGAERVALEDIKFDDGDTFFVKGEAIRLLGADTPEIAHPKLGIHEGQPYGDVAAESTQVWLEHAAVIEIVRGGPDMFNRRLAHVFIDGELLAVRLLRHGLAYETVRHYGDSGFPDLAQEILDASRTAPKPKFEPPYRWKSRQRKKAAKERDG